MLGGTEFVGRAFVDEAWSRGWTVTVFNRGTHEPPEGVAALRGDRTDPGAGLAAIAHGEWDLVVDTWSGAPAVVRDTARLLADRAGLYVYVSSRSVYAYPTPPGAAEDAPLVDAAPDDGDVPYARAKAGGELAAVESFGDRALLVRAGLILGPYENIGRLPWWLLRIARGGQVPAPGPADLELQYVDARDLAAWSLDAAARGLGGPYNLVSRPGHATMGELLDSCVRVTAANSGTGSASAAGTGSASGAGTNAMLRWVSPDQVRAAGVEPWTELPIWLPPGELHDSLHRSDVSKALAAGLTCRPIADTVADTWAWLRSIGGVPPLRPDRPQVGLSAAAEARLLASPLR